LPSTISTFAHFNHPQNSTEIISAKAAAEEKPAAAAEFTGHNSQKKRHCQVVFSYMLKACFFLFQDMLHGR
jgi:hypothetical protein